MYKITKTSILLILLEIYIMKNIFFNFSTLNTDYTFSTLSKMLTFIIVIAIFFIFISDFKDTLKVFMSAYIFFIIILISSYLSGDISIMIYFLFALSLMNVQNELIVKRILLTQLFAVGIIVFLYILKIIPESVSTRYGITRYSLGFNHPGHISTFFLYIVMEYVYLSKRNIKTIVWVFIWIVMFFLNKFTDGRTAFFCFLIYVFLLILTKFQVTKKVIYVSNIVLPFFYIIISLYIAAKMKMDNLYYFLDNIFSGRLYFMKLFYDNYGISLFGKHLITVTTYQSHLSSGTTAQVLDSFYLSLLIKYGLLFLIIFLWIVTKANKTFFKYNQVELLLMLFITLLFSFIANIATLVEVNCVFLLFFKKNKYLFDKGKFKIGL